MWMPSKNRLLLNLHQVEGGFSLIEAAVSLLVLFAMLSGLIPAFLTSRLNTVNNSIKTGAIALSQQILDELRQDPDIETWPNSGTLTMLPSGESIETLNYEDRSYNADLTYCSDTDKCNEKTRQISLEIRHNNNIVYTIETVYTRFE